jgi:tetratricopeptide (TPR) repeat protein
MHDARDAEDKRLLEAGEHAALLRGYYETIILRCRVRCRTEDDALECAQSVAVRLLSELKRGKRYPVPFRVVVHKVIEWTTKGFYERGRAVLVELEDDLFGAGNPFADVETRYALERALAALADAVAIDPEARRPHFRRMVVLDQLGRHEAAAGERATWLRLFGDHAAADRLADLAQRCGYRAAMVDWIGRLAKLNQWFEAAIQAMAIGDRAQALDAIERCLEERADNAPFIAEFPPFRPLRGEPQFDRLLQKLGLLSPLPARSP